jgi:hypothetical protein
MLPNAIQFKLTGAAHYWWRYGNNVAQFRKLARWAQQVVDAREHIRQAATVAFQSLS